MMNNPMEIFRSADGQAQIAVRAKQQNVWLRIQQIADIFGRDTLVSLQHLKNACTKGELAHGEVVAKSASGFYRLQPAQVPRNTLRSVALCQRYPWLRTAWHFSVLPRWAAAPAETARAISGATAIRGRGKS